MTIKLIKDQQNSTHNNSAALQIREEQLDISKKKVQTAEVSVHREFITLEKTITVPITREELVIEKKILASDSSDTSNGETEILRIPIREENIEIVKHPVDLEDVEIHKRQLHETQHIEEVLRKEKINIKTTGNPIIINEGD